MSPVWQVPKSSLPYGFGAHSIHLATNFVKAAGHATYLEPLIEGRALVEPVTEGWQPAMLAYLASNYNHLADHASP